MPPRDEKALAEAILLLLNDAALGHTLSHNAREDVVLRFDTRRCVDQLMLSLDEL